MGLCNCNPKSGIILRADYIVPDNTNNTNGRTTLGKVRSFNDIKHCSTNTFSEDHTFKVGSSNSGKLNEQTYHKTTRSMLLNKMTEKNAFPTQNQTRESSQHYKTFNNEKVYMKEITSPLSKENNDIIKKALSNHFLFSKLTEANHNYILKKIKQYAIEEKDHIFIEGEEGNNMFIIVSGKVEMYKDGTKKIIVKSKEEAFGELGVFSHNSLRTYSVKAIMKGIIIGIDYSLFKEFKAQLIQVDNELAQLIMCVPLFKYLEEVDMINMSKFAYKVTMNKNEHLTTQEAFYIMKSGTIIYKKKKGYFEMKSNSFAGLRNLLLDSTPKTYQLQAKTQSEIYIFPLQAFIEIFGMDISYQLIFPYFKYAMAHNTFFSTLFNELQLVPISQLFKLKEYKQNTIVCHKHTSGKILIILKGQLYYQPKNNEKTIDLEMGSVYGDQLLTSGRELDSEIIAKYNSLIIECEWGEMKGKVTSFNSSIMKKMKNLSMVGLMKNINESKLLEISCNVQKIKYSHGEIICSKELNNDKLFMVIKGEAKLKYNKKTLRRYSNGNCFGEIYLLDIQAPGMTIVSSSEKLVLYSITGDYFANLIKKNTFHQYIHNKICNEDPEISYNDLYILKKLSIKSYLVHNTNQLYMVDTRIKNQKELQYATNSIKSSKHLDHPFLVKYIKMVESKSHAVFIYEYIDNSLSFAQLMQSNQIYINKKSSIVFYAACLIHVLNYINSKRFIHRNINPENILIDSNGYIKLLNFSLAKRIKSTMMTKTVIGIPCYSAPEVLKGDFYSYSCDYWSIGVVLYQFYYDSLPFETKETDDPFTVYNKIIHNDFDYHKCNDKAKQLFIALLNNDVTRRCTSLETAKKLTCFKDINFDHLVSYNIEPPLIPPKTNEDTAELLTIQSNPLLMALEQKNINTHGIMGGSWEDLF